MIIYGSRMYFKRNVVNTFGACQYCGAYGKQASYQAKKFGHLYFIPLIPLGAQSQVLNECSSCQMGAHIPIEELEPRVESLKDQLKSWITDIQNGKAEVVPEGGTEPVNTGVLIAGTLEDLYCLKEIEGVDSISEILLSSNLEFENNIVLGRWNEMKGDLAAAKLKYQAACKLRPDDPVPIFQIGAVAMKQGDAAEAEEAFEKYLTICPDDLSALAELAGLYESQKDYPKIIKTYDRLYALNPELLSNKDLKKVYKKSCKKTGEQGQFLDQL